LAQPKNFLEGLDLAVDAGGPQFLRTDEALAVIGEIDCADTPESDLFAAALLKPVPEEIQGGPVATPGGLGRIGRLKVAGELVEERIPQDDLAVAYYTHSQPPR
jgi:hypothetical protein